MSRHSSDAGRVAGNGRCPGQDSVSRHSAPRLVTPGLVNPLHAKEQAYPETHPVLLVEPVYGRAFQYAMPRTASAEEAATALAKHGGLPSDVVRLHFRGKYVHGATPFADAQRDEVLRMVLRAPLVGGGCSASRPEEHPHERLNEQPPAILGSDGARDRVALPGAKAADEAQKQEHGGHHEMVGTTGTHAPETMERGGERSGVSRVPLPRNVFRHEAEMREWLQKHDVPVDGWSADAASAEAKSTKTKTVSNLWHEVEQGECALTYEEGRALREVRVAKLRVLHPEQEPSVAQHLIEVKQSFVDGAERLRGDIPGEKLKRDETAEEGAIRGVKEELGWEVANTPRLLHKTVEVKPSDSYPGLMSRYTFFEYALDVRGHATAQLAPTFTTVEDDDKRHVVHHWEWRDATLQLCDGLVLAEPDMRLLERLFERATRVKVSALHGGLSSSLVLRTQAFYGDAPDEPTVTKLDDAVALMSEVARTNEAARLGVAVARIARGPCFSEERTSHSLAFVEAKIDAPLRERLADGSIRLVRCAWLRSDEADAALERDLDGTPLVKRRQDLPFEAFVPAAEAVELLQRDDRSVLVLSYAWQTPMHPDPHGTTLAAVRSYLRETRDADGCALFWDFLSLHQRDAAGERTEEETAAFRRALGVMGLLYASLTSTTVLLQTEVPPQPDRYVGQLTVWNVLDEASLREEMKSHGAVVNVALMGTTALITFETDDMARTARDALNALKESRATLSYNERPYANRGWTTFECGTARIITAHLAASVDRLPMRFQLAQQSRDKVVDISGGTVKSVQVHDAHTELVNTRAAIERAIFTGKADEATVKDLISRLDSVVLEGLKSWEREPASATMAGDQRGAVVLEMAGACWLMPEFSEQAGDKLITTLKANARRQLAWRRPDNLLTRLSGRLSGRVSDSRETPDIAGVTHALFGPGGPISTLALRSVRRGERGSMFGRWRAELAARAAAVLVRPEDVSGDLAKALRTSAAGWLEEKHAKHFANSFVHHLGERSVTEPACTELLQLLTQLGDAPWAMTWAPLQVHVHGDLNLANVLVDKQEELWLIDFAKAGVGGVADDAAFFLSRLLFQHAPIPPTLDDVRTVELETAAGVPRPNLLVDVLGLSSAQAKELQEAVRANVPTHAATEEWFVELMGDEDEAEAALHEMELVIDSLVGADDPWAPKCPGSNSKLKSKGARDVFDLCDAVARRARGLCSRCSASIGRDALDGDALDAHPTQLLLPLLAHALTSLRYPQLSCRHKRLAWYAVHQLAVALRRHVAQRSLVPAVLPAPARLPWAESQPIVETSSRLDGGEGSVKLVTSPSSNVKRYACSEVVLPWQTGADGSAALEDARRASKDVEVLRTLSESTTAAATAQGALRDAVVTSEAARRAMATAIKALEELMAKQPRGEPQLGEAQVGVEEKTQARTIMDRLWQSDVHHEVVAAWRATGAAGVRHYARGTLLAVSADGRSWRDARVETANGARHRLVWLDDDSSAELVLHPWNHGLRELSMEEHQAVRERYARKLRTSHATIVDALSGKRLNVDEQLIPLAVSASDMRTAGKAERQPVEHFGDVGSLADELLKTYRARREGRTVATTERACVLLTGPPAAGKTCLMSQLVTRVLKDHTLVPILVRVQHLQRLLLLEEHRDTFETAWNWVDAYLQCVHGADADIYRMLRGIMHARRALLLLDGIDEGGRKRAAVERHVTEVLAPQGHSLLVTSRPAGLEWSRFEAHFVALELRPLDEAQQRIVVERRVRDARRGKELWRQIEAIPSEHGEHGERVTSNPLMLSMVISLYEARGAVPQNIAKLYEAASHAMLERVERKERGAAGVTHLHSVLQAIFFEAHVAQRRIFEEAQLLAAAVSLHASAADRLAKLRWPSHTGKPAVGEYVEVRRGEHAGKRGTLSKAGDGYRPYQVTFEDETTSDRLGREDLESSGMHKVDFDVQYHRDLLAAHDALPVELREALGVLRERVGRGRVPLLSLLQAEPLQLQASHLSFQEYHTACALVAGEPLPTGALPWQWTSWWANVLRIGEAHGAAFQAGLRRAARVGQALELSQMLVADKVALQAVLLLATTATSVDLSRNRLDAAGGSMIASALKVNASLTQLNLRSNYIGSEGAKSLADALKVNASLSKPARTKLWMRMQQEGRPITTILRCPINTEELQNWVDKADLGEERNEAMALIKACSPTERGERGIEIRYRHSNLGADLVAAGFVMQSREYAIGIDPFKCSKRVRAMALSKYGQDFDDSSSYPRASAFLLTTGKARAQQLLEDKESILREIGRYFFEGTSVSPDKWRANAKLLINLLDMDGTYSAWRATTGARADSKLGQAQLVYGAAQKVFDLAAYVKEQPARTREAASRCPEMLDFVTRATKGNGNEPPRTLKSYILQEAEGVSRLAKLEWCKEAGAEAINLQHDGVTRTVHPPVPPLAVVEGGGSSPTVEGEKEW